MTNKNKNKYKTYFLCKDIDVNNDNTNYKYGIVSLKEC